jgi:hypothetical protein
MEDYIFTTVTQDSTPEERTEFEHQLLKEINQELTPLDCVDYSVDEAGKIPLSFVQIKTVEEGFGWYRRHHPELLDDLVWAMARHQFGDAEERGAPPLKTPPPPAVSFTHKHIQLEF